MTSSATMLALWVRSRYHQPEPMTHLKLHKLMFYAFGALCAAGLERRLGAAVAFEPWEHGPVCREVWWQFRACGRDPLPAPATATPRLDAEVERTLEDVIEVYGRLDAWSLRNESHLEQPWIDAWNARAARIPAEAIREHFRRKFATGAVQPPRHLFDPGSFWLDGIPIVAYASLHALAESLRRCR